MASDTILSYSVDLTDVAKALATIPDQAGAEGAKAAERLSKALSKATKVQQQVLRANKAAADAAKESANAAKEQRNSFLDLAEMAGGPSKDSIDKLIGAFSAFGPVGGAAAVAAVGVAGAVTGAAIAATAAAVGIVSLVHGAGDLARSLQEVEKVGGATSTIGVSQSQIAAFDRAAASLDSISLLAQQFGLVLASELAPAVETGARAVLKLALMSRDFFNEISGGQGVLEGLATFAAQGLVAALLQPVEVLSHWTRAFGEVARLAGFEDLADRAVGIADSWVKTRNSIASAGLDLVFDASSKAVDYLSDKTSSYDDEIDQLIGTQSRYTKNTREAGAAAEAARKAEEDRRVAMAALEADLGRIAASQREATKAAQDAGKTTSDLLARSQAFGAAAPSAVEAAQSSYADLNSELLRQIETNLAAGVSTEALEAERIALASRAKDEIVRLRAEEAAATQAGIDASAQAARDSYLALQSEVLSSVQGTIGALSSAFDAYSGLLSEKYAETQEALTAAKAAADSEQTASLEKTAKRQKGILITLFAAEQGAALAQVVIDTALAVSKISATWAAVPPVAGALTALAIGTGVAQAAAISAARPSFHRGGVVPQASAGQGEVMSRLLPGEVVLNRGAVDRMGGASAADRMNRGGSGGSGQIVVVQQYGHRTFEEVVYDDVRRPDSSLRRAVKGTTRVGHRSR